jgi:ZU5 domain
MHWRHLGLLLMPVVTASAGACKTNNVEANTQNSTDVIGAMGGMVVGLNGEELIIPAGALTANVSFQLGVAQPGSSSYPANPPSGLDFAGDVFEFLPHGTQFATPATVVIPFTTATSSPVLLQAEEGASSWTTLGITGMMGTTAVEGAVTTLSYFVVAYQSSGDGGQSSGCSGRGPSGSAPTATVSSFTGSVEDPISGQMVDLTNIVDGYATAQSGMGSFVMTFTQYPSACGYEENNDLKVASEQVVLVIIPSSGSVSVQTYTSNIGAMGYDPAGDAGAGACPTAMRGPIQPGATGAGITITAVDSSSVSGNFSFTPGGGSGTPISGMFNNVPFCTPTSGVTPQCCLP